jgi:hypothetical protein
MRQPVLDDRGSSVSLGRQVHLKGGIATAGGKVALLGDVDERRENDETRSSLLRMRRSCAPLSCAWQRVSLQCAVDWLALRFFAAGSLQTFRG